MASSPVPSPSCRRCGRVGSLRRRGLCYGCYFEPGVRGKYEPTSAMANRGVGAGEAKIKNATEIEQALRPLRCRRDDPQRIIVLMLRAKYKLPSYCYGDRRLEDDDAPVDLDDLFFF